MEWTILLAFLFICLGLGYAVVRFLLDEKQSFWDVLLLSLVVGVATVPLAFIVFRILHLPLNILFFIILAALAPAYDIVKGRKLSFTISPQQAVVRVVMILAVVALTHMLFTGATNYPWLENDDPWSHAAGAHYVALERTTAQPVPFTSYLEPYPPFFTGLLGVLHQLTTDLQWVMKFFNALLVGLSVLAAFYLFRALFHNEVAAAAGAIILGWIPGYMSHFIFSQTLAIPVFLITVWSLAYLREVKKPSRMQIVAVGLLVFSSTIIQTSTAVIFAGLFILFAGLDSLQQKRITASAQAVVSGGILSFLYWFSMFLVYGAQRFFDVLIVSGDIFTGATADTSGGIIYSLGDFLFPAMSSKIDQATGIGWLVFVLVGIAIILAAMNYQKLWTKKNISLVFGLCFLVISILGVQGNAFPFKIFPHRFWVFLAIACALLVVFAVHTLMNLHKNQWVKLGIAAGVVVVVLLTIMPARVAVQQAQWPPGVSWTSQEQLQGYVSLTALESTSVFPLCKDSKFVIGMNHHAMPWDEDELAFRQNLESATPESISQFTRSKGYQLILFDSACVAAIGENASNTLLQEMGASGLFGLANQQPGFVVLQVG